ncbi:hypothetical protein IAR55_002472 [Kwoniella newhampshirensis]|uniref:Uncharacterized protein n=1 Tax=Kwoniella newhampshirensis TaxID=1651941 RepID=A0AAW0Z155_9TREE
MTTNNIISSYSRFSDFVNLHCPWSHNPLGCALCRHPPPPDSRTRPLNPLARIFIPHWYLRSFSHRDNGLPTIHENERYSYGHRAGWPPTGGPPLPEQIPSYPGYHAPVPSQNMVFPSTVPQTYDSAQIPPCLPPYYQPNVPGPVLDRQLAASTAQSHYPAGHDTGLVWENRPQTQVRPSYFDGPTWSTNSIRTAQPPRPRFRAPGVKTPQIRITRPTTSRDMYTPSGWTPRSIQGDGEHDPRPKSQGGGAGAADHTVQEVETRQLKDDASTTSRSGKRQKAEEVGAEKEAGPSEGLKEGSSRAYEKTLEVTYTVSRRRIVSAPALIQPGLRAWRTFSRVV